MHGSPSPYQDGSPRPVAIDHQVWPPKCVVSVAVTCSGQAFSLAGRQICTRMAVLQAAYSCFVPRAASSLMHRQACLVPASTSL